jgi:hypothetical protein
MHIAKVMSAVAVAAVAFGATAANAQGPNTGTCIKMQKQVSAALDANQSSANLKAAKDEQSAGAYYCGSRLYDKGVAHYQAALDLLGQK